MIFDQIFVEEAVVHHPQTTDILSRLNRTDFHQISKLEDIFGRTRKPYLHKRTNLNLFIGRKLGKLVKPAPPAYGTQTGHHYYFIHQYNCIYECQYCYLQGYFDSPDIVLFVNHDEICDEIVRYSTEVHSPEDEVWFHAGEFSDSLALSGLTREWRQYWECFKKLPNAKLELRTKSINTRIIEDLEPLSNIVISYSISPQKTSLQMDLKTPPMVARLRSIQRLSQRGFKLGFHLDPIILSPDWLELYRAMAEELSQSVDHQLVEYISIGTVRFTKSVYRDVQKNYPDSMIMGQAFQSGSDHKFRYRDELNGRMMQQIRTILTDAGFDDAKIYECMAQDDAPASACNTMPASLSN
jgi:spore photoproduct lyase